MASKCEQEGRRPRTIGLRASLITVLPLIGFLICMLAVKVAFSGLAGVQSLDRSIIEMRFATKRLLILATGSTAPQFSVGPNGVPGADTADLLPGAPTAKAMLAIKDVQVAALLLRDKVTEPFRAAGVLAEPFLSVLHGKRLPERLQKIWDREPGLAGMIPALIQLDDAICAPPECTLMDEVERARAAAGFRTGLLIAQALPEQLTAMSRAMADWRSRMSSWAYGLLLVSAAFAILGVLLTVRVVIQPLARRLDVARDRLALQGVVVEKQVAERTRELSAMVTEANSAVVAKSTFLANMSHEIRTPMNGVLGVAALLERSDLNESQHALVKTIMQSGTMLLRLIDDVLDAAKISAGRLQIAPRSVRMPELLQEVVALHAPSANQKGLTLSCDVTHAGSSEVFVDPERLLQVLNNLVGNAIKFTKEGSVAVRLRETDLGALTRVRIDIEDTGIGIAVEDQARIFKPFERVHDGMELPGAGIGLALSHTLMRAMGGKLTVSSRPGEGARFRISLPVPRADVDDLETVDPTRQTPAA